VNFGKLELGSRDTIRKLAPVLQLRTAAMSLTDRKVQISHRYKWHKAHVRVERDDNNGKGDDPGKPFAGVRAARAAVNYSDSQSCVKGSDRASLDDGA
jgi:hypothetical protein